MLKLLFVEDEAFVREGISTFLRDTFELEVLIAENGKIGLEIAILEKPDILLCDIRMPEMDGIELLRMLAVKQLHPVSILLTAHAEFIYAQSAIQYGVRNYLLKPISREDLVKNVNEAIAIVKEKIDYDQELQKKDLLDAIHGYKTIELPTYAEFVALAGFHVVASSFGSFKRMDFDLIRFSLENVTHEVLSNQEFEWTLLVETNHCFFLTIFIQKSNSKLLNHQMSENIKALVWKISQVLKTLLKLKTVESVSGIVPFADLNKAYIEVSASLEKGIHLHPILPSSRDKPLINGGFIDFITIEEKCLILPIREGRLEDLDQLAERILKNYENDIGMLQSVCFRILYFICGALQEEGGQPCIEYFHSLSVSSEINKRSSYFSLSDWLRTILREFSILYTQKTPISTHPIIAVIEQKILKNATVPLLLKDIAVELKMNPAYLSDLFAKEVGESFTDFSVRVKMERAKSKLLLTNTKVYEVAMELGYSDGRFFSQLFRRYTGISPKQFQLQGGFNNVQEE